MTKKDKTLFLSFIIRTGMYIYPADNNNIVSFIHGYEIGTKDKCDFTQLVKQLLTDKYKINYSNQGWPGQITQLAKNLSLSWVTTFKRITLEIIANEKQGGLDKSMAKALKGRIVELIERVNENGHPWFNDSWKEEWLSCVV